MCCPVLHVALQVLDFLGLLYFAFTKETLKFMMSCLREYKEVVEKPEPGKEAFKYAAPLNSP